MILTNVFWSFRNLEIYCSPGDSKLTPDGLGLQWNGHSKFSAALNLELLGRNIAPLHFKTERLAKTVLRASWFWPTSSGVSGTWEIYCSPGDSKLTPDGLGLQWNGHSKFFAGLTLELLGRNRAPLHFKTERVAETALRASWFCSTSARFSWNWGIFSSAGISKLNPDVFIFAEMDTG